MKKVLNQTSAVARIEAAEKLKQDALKDLGKERNGIVKQLAKIDELIKQHGGALDTIVKKRKKRSVPATDETIIKFIGDGEVATGDIVATFGQTVPKKLKAMVKAGKLSVRKEGVKSLYKVK